MSVHVSRCRLEMVDLILLQFLHFFFFCYLWAAANSTPKESAKETEEEAEKKLNVTATCCQCPKTKEELDAEARIQEIEIYFENYLHDQVYCQRWLSFSSYMPGHTFVFFVTQCVFKTCLRYVVDKWVIYVKCLLPVVRIKDASDIQFKFIFGWKIAKRECWFAERY